MLPDLISVHSDECQHSAVIGGRESVLRVSGGVKSYLDIKKYISLLRHVAAPICINYHEQLVNMPDQFYSQVISILIHTLYWLFYFYNRTVHGKAVGSALVPCKYPVIFI